MAVIIEEVALVRHPKWPVLKWDEEALGMRPGDGVNIRIKLAGAELPAAVMVMLESRAPNQAKTVATMAHARWYSVPRAPQYGRGVYYHSLSLSDVGDFLQVQNPKVLELAMLHRANEVVAGASTSYLSFQQGGSWVMRGIAEQPTTPSPGVGNEMKEVPGALQLLRAGGLEVLQVTLKPPAGWKLARKGADRCSRLVRSPADVFYFTGHAKFSSFLVYSGGSYKEWYSFKDLCKDWPRQMDTDCLVIAGCNALSFGGDDLRPLLLSGNGPLRAIVGYAMNEEIAQNQGKAPRDNQGGSTLAKKYAAAIAASADRDYVKLWMDLHRQLFTTQHVSWALTAAALDSAGRFWQMKPKTGEAFMAEEYNQKRAS
jgi:hypothetical protein